MTFVYVTHDQEEALTMSDRVAVFNEGRIEQVGTPRTIYEQPATEFVAGFVGTSNILERDGRRFSVRPERIGAETATTASRATIADVVFVGAFTRYLVDTRRGGELVGRPPEPETSHRRTRVRRAGETVRLAWRPRRTRSSITGGAGGRMRSGTWALGALVVALAVPAAGVSPAAGCRRRSARARARSTLIAWEGYTQPQWVKPFEKQTGCKVHAKYAGSSDEMVTLMRSGGGSQYDMVSASGDASLRLIYGKDVAAGRRRRRSPTSRTSSRRSSRRRTTRSTASTTASRSSGARTRCSTTRRR